MQEQRNKLINLLNKKLRLTQELKNKTESLSKLSVKGQYNEINEGIASRQENIYELEEIEKEIQGIKMDFKQLFNEIGIKYLTDEIRNLYKEILALDKDLRLKLNNELKEVKKNLNDDESKKVLNIKA